MTIIYRNLNPEELASAVRRAVADHGIANDDKLAALVEAASRFCNLVDAGVTNLRIRLYEDERETDNLLEFADKLLSAACHGAKS